MKKTIFLALTGIFLLVGGYEIFNAFMLQHTYYASMFATMRNRWLVLGAFACAAPAMYYFFKNDNYKLPIVGYLVAGGLAIFGLWHTGITDSLWFGRLGVLMQLINTAILVFLSLYFILGVQSLGSIIVEKIGIIQKRWQEMLLSFGIGLGLLLFVVHYLVFLHLLYGIVVRAIFLGLGYLTYKNWNTRLAYRRQVVETILQETKSLVIKDGTLQASGYIFLFLIAACIVYYFFGFQLSFIPYPTAWDANHAYMYVPKVWAENHGALGVGQTGGVASYLWFSYIAFWFALIEPIKSFFWLAPDTIAVSMNFLSGIFVMIFGLGLIRETLGYISKKIGSTGLLTGRIGTLLWLTSGMGAFLVFVDNKTDLGVMAMTLLAVLSGMIFLDYMDDHKAQHTLQSQSTKYVLISSLLFGLAVMAKPTAFIDVAVFAIFVLGLWFWNGVAIGAGITLIGILGKLQVLTTSEFLMPSEGMTLIVVGVIIMILSFVYMVWRRKAGSVIAKLGRIFIIWAVGIGVVLLIGKGPYILYSQIATDTFSIGNFAKGLLLSNTPSDVKDTTYQGPQRVLASIVDPNTCSLASLGITQDQLYSGLITTTSNGLNEDVGRYIGFGQREFSAPKLWNVQEKSAYGFLRLGYHLLRLVFPQDNKCFAHDSIAKALCEQPALVDNFDIPKLQAILQQGNKKSKGYQVLSGLLADDTVIGILSGNKMDLSTLRSEIIQLRQFYQSYSIKTTTDSIFVPYRYLVPMNIVFNRSLQNMSSYYTDIGFVWLLVMGMILIATIYFAVTGQSKKLSLALATLIGWTVWRIIGGGILRYGIGLIMRSILVVSVFLEDILDEEKHVGYRKYMWYAIVGLALLWVFVQWFMNAMRIASQGASGPFVWYKESVGQTIEYSNQLVPEQGFKVGYNWKDVFNLQFPHYNKFVEYVKDRPNKDGIHIEGTYLQYFLDNQYNVGGIDLAYLLSDGNTCKGYLRIVDKSKKWIVIDPNVLSVVMGEGNESLLWRFFGKRNANNQKFDQYGNVSMLVKLWQDGYISLFSSNNLGSKYAFSLSDAELQSYFGGTGESLLNTRSRLAVARFFPDTVNNMVQFIGQTFTARMANGLAIGDMADIIGKTINEPKLLEVAQAVINGSNPATLTQAIDELTQDERIVLVQYLNMYTMLRQDNQQYMQALNQLLGQSVGGGSQIIILEVKD